MRFLYLLLTVALAPAIQTAVGETQAKLIRDSGKLATGTKWETKWYSIDTGLAGPTVVITGGIHGNEPAGSFAANQIKFWEIDKGKLLIVPSVNKLALAANTRRTPDFPEETGDLNRCFPKTGEPNKAKTELSAALWKFVQNAKPDWVIDLHEGFAIHRQNPESVGSTILCKANDETRPLFEKALATVNSSIEDEEKHFVLLSRSETANGSLTRASMERLGANIAIMETTYKEIPLAVRVRQHRLLVHSVLSDIGMVSSKPDQFYIDLAADERTKVAIFHDSGVGSAGPKALRRMLGKAANFSYRTIGAGEIKAGALEQFDVVIFPGGSGSKQALALGEDGKEAVRRYIENGGGFMGICAGCYLACENFKWSLKVLDAKTLSSKWRRGRKTLTLDFSDSHLSLLGLDKDKAKVMYSNGPVMAPAESPDIPDYQTLATFVDEVAENGTPEGIQIGSPAIVKGQFGKGRVVGISPHPEQTPELEKIMLPLIGWSAGRN